MKRRVFLAISAMVLALAVTVGYFSASQIRADYLDSMERQLCNALGTLLYVGENGGDLYTYAGYIAKSYSARVSIISPEGDFLYDSDGKSEAGILGVEEIKQANASKFGITHRYDGGIPSIIVAAALTGGGYARISLPAGDVIERSDQLYSRILIIIVLCTLALLIITWRFSSIIILPINEMTEVARDYSAGHYTRFMSKKYSGELGVLAETLNTMSNRLVESNETLAQENAKLEAIMEAMGSGILAVDSERKLITANTSAEKLLGINRAGNIVLGDISQQLDGYIARALTGVVMESEDIVINVGKATEKFIRVSSSRMKVEDRAPGAIAILDDISDYKRLENIRSEFAANASHELKTPLTSIHGFVETLQQGVDDPKQAQRFLQIILNETDRLTRLINDILYLSELETAHDEPHDRVDVGECIEETMEIMRPQAKSKGLELAFMDKSGGVSHTLGSKDRIVQMMVNLLSNAIKYTPEGSVSVELQAAADHVVVSVSDTGIGIPASAQTRLFERFYRVDKGRSREMGGTGLGLAIVKHVVLSMHGDVTVESLPGEGSTFTIILPRD